MKKLFLQSGCIAFVFCALLLNSCKEDTPVPEITKFSKDYSVDVAVSWFKLHMKLVKETSGFSPPVAARSFGYAGMCLYESIVEGSRDLRPLSNLINEYKGVGLPVINKSKKYNWEVVANAAMASFYRSLFKTATANNIAAIEALESQIYLKNQAEEIEVLERSVEYGRKIAQVIYDFSKTDGQDLAYNSNFDPNYVLPVFPGAWIPTSSNNPKPLQPYWGSVRPFLLANIDNSLNPNHLPYSTDKNSLFYLEALEVYLYGKNLTEEQKIIAKYWSDDPGLTATPPGHSISIALNVLSTEKADLEYGTEVMVKVGMAVHDAFVSCWKCKYAYNLLRPISYIQAQIDPTYTTLLNTPPFPEHTSGHSVQTGASMEVLENYFGQNYNFIDKTHENRLDINGSPRTFNSFDAIAKEAAISRLYGGIHYRTGIDAGVDQGKAIGRNISDINLRK